jgi:phosphate transport system permease protein
MIERIRILKDKIAERAMLFLTLLSILVMVLIGVGLYVRSGPLLVAKSLGELLTSSVWRPMKGEFGFFAFIMGTLWVTAIAILIALPLSLLTAIYLSEYASHRVRRLITPLIDLLSGIPPVVYGVWGVLFIIPLIRLHVSEDLGKFSSGYSVLAGGIVLAVMIIPLIISILFEIFAAVPGDVKLASLSLGATQWQTVKYVILKKSAAGIFAATVLAISRSFGETIAVLMVCGNMPLAPHSVWDPGYPLPALIANNYGEMLSVPKYDSALLFAALILFVIIFLFNAASRIILKGIENRNT